MITGGGPPTPSLPVTIQNATVTLDRFRSLGAGLVKVLGFPTLHVATASGTEGGFHWGAAVVPLCCSLSAIQVLGAFAWGVSFLGGWGGKAWANGLERQLCETVWM